MRTLRRPTARSKAMSISRAWPQAKYYCMSTSAPWPAATLRGSLSLRNCGDECVRLHFPLIEMVTATLGKILGRRSWWQQNSSSSFLIGSS